VSVCIGIIWRSTVFKAILKRFSIAVTCMFQKSEAVTDFSWSDTKTLWENYSIFPRYDKDILKKEKIQFDQQRAVLHKAFEALLEVKTPGTIIDLFCQWRRQSYK
jgi:hypothetical protein